MKILKIFAGIGMLIAAGMFIYKAFKKELADIDRVEKIEEARFDEIGLKKSKFDNEIDEDVDDLSKGLFVGARFGNKFDGDGDIIDPEESYKYNNVIHVRTDTEKLILSMEIPKGNRGSNFREPKIGDYIRGFSNAGRYINENIIKTQRRIKFELVGYYMVSYVNTDSGEKIYKSIRIPRENYEQYSTENHDGLTEYINNIRQDPEVILKKNMLLPNELDNIDDLELLEIMLTYEMSYPIQTDTELGANLFNGLESLKYLTTDLEITKGRDSVVEPVRYDHVIFHIPDKNGKPNLLQYYDTDNTNTVVIRDFTYEDC